MKLFFLLLSISSILGANLHKIISHKSRFLADITTLNFVSVENLFFNSDSTWQFDVKYSGATLEISKTYTIPILYKGAQSSALCIVKENSILNCSPNDNAQTKNDLVQLNNAEIESATIKWNNLDSNYDMTINATLNYVGSYNLIYFPNGYSPYWEFKIKISENALPENGKVNVDLFYSSISDKYIFATCTYKELFLFCKFSESRGNKFLVQISPKRSLGSIKWQNLDKNETIPFFVGIVNIGDVDGLELINNQYNFNMIANVNISLGSISDIFTLNTKLKKLNNEEIILPTRCYSTKTDKLFKCIVEGENQESTD